MLGLKATLFAVYDRAMSEQPATGRLGRDVRPPIEGEKALVRAFWSKYTVATAKRAPEPLKRSVLASISSELRSEIRNAPTFDWQDARVFVALTGAIARLGDESAIAFWRYSLRQSISQPLIRTLVEGGMSLFGRSPLALYKRTPRAWSLVSRDCGVIEVDDGGDGRSAIMTLHDVPESCRGHAGLVTMLAGGVRGQGDFCMVDVRGDVRAPRFSTHGEAELHISW